MRSYLGGDVEARATIRAFRDEQTGYICNMREKKGLIRQNELNREGFRGEDMTLE